MMAQFTAHDQPSWDLGEDAPTVSCRNCYWFDWNNEGSCKAFPKGIPHNIAYGEDLHNTPIEGDHGIQFKPWQHKILEDQVSPTSWEPPSE